MTSLFHDGVTRRLVLGGALAATPLFGASAASYATMSATGKRFTKEVGKKFYADGRPRFFPGCTLISHVAADSPLHGCLDRIIDRAKNEAVMKKFALLPKSSLHMTLMNGIDDEHRVPPFWPASVPVTASLQYCREWCAERLRKFHTRRAGDFQMIQDQDFPLEHLNSFTIRLKSANAAQEASLRQLRDRLSERLEIREPGHATYGFHITLAYQIEYLSDAEAEAFAAFYRDVRAALAAAVPVLSIGQPEFCTFEDMFVFERQFYLQD